MRAVVLSEFSGPDGLTVRELPYPDPGPGEVVVRLRAAALNRRDLFATRGQYPGLTLPAVPGSDGAGWVEQLGSGVTGWEPGAAVIINPALDWGDDPRASGPGFNILGIPKNGTFAEFVTVPAANLAPKPAHLSWEEAAALPLGGLTAYRALFTRGGLAAGETVLIPGVGGGVATFLVQLALVQGARVAVTSSRDDKLRKAEALGAAAAVRYDLTGWVDQMRTALGGGADLVVDGVGGPVLQDLLRLLKAGGRLVSYGATRGPVPEVVLPRLFLRHQAILGTSMGSPEDFRAMLALVNQSRLVPVVDRVLPLERIGEALRLMDQGDQFGKVVLKIA